MLIIHFSHISTSCTIVCMGKASTADVKLYIKLSWCTFFVLSHIPSFVPLLSTTLNIMLVYTGNKGKNMLWNIKREIKKLLLVDRKTQAVYTGTKPGSRFNIMGKTKKEHLDLAYIVKCLVDVCLIQLMMKLVQDWLKGLMNLVVRMLTLGAYRYKMFIKKSQNSFFIKHEAPFLNIYVTLVFFKLFKQFTFIPIQQCFFQGLLCCYFVPLCYCSSIACLADTAIIICKSQIISIIIQ